MAKTITVTLSDAQYKAFEHVAYDPTSWTQHVVEERCRTAIEEIARKEIDRKLEAGESISGTKEEIVLAANIKTAKQISEEHNAALSGSQ